MKKKRKETEEGWLVHSYCETGIYYTEDGYEKGNPYGIDVYMLDWLSEFSDKKVRITIEEIE